MKRGKSATSIRVALITTAIRNVFAIRVRGMTIRQRRQVPRVMFRARCAILAARLSTRERRMPAQVPKLATAAVRPERRSVTRGQFRNLIPVDLAVRINVLWPAVRPAIPANMRVVLKNIVLSVVRQDIWIWIITGAVELCLVWLNEHSLNFRS